MSNNMSIDNYCQALMVMIGYVSDEALKLSLTITVKDLVRDHGEIHPETVGQIADRLNEGELE